MRKFLVLIAALTALGLAPVAAAAPDAIVDESFSDGTDNVFSSSAWGMVPLPDGHEGPGLQSVIPAGEHWDFADHGLAEPEELWWRYWVWWRTHSTPIFWTASADTTRRQCLLKWLKSLRAGMT